MLWLSQDPDWCGRIDGKDCRGTHLRSRKPCRDAAPARRPRPNWQELRVYLSYLTRLRWHGVMLGLRSLPGFNRGRSPDEPHAHFRREASAASAFRTSDCEIPNCRAIRDGVIPALKAARTAFNFPLVNESGTSSNRRLRGLSSKAEGFLPRRRCSAKAAATNGSSSGSVSRFIAFGRSLGRTYGHWKCLPGMMKVGLPATKSYLQPSRTGRVSLNPVTFAHVLILPPPSQGSKGRAVSGEYSCR
jgi:hypothetical protein